MIFGSEVARQLFHELAIDQQIAYNRLDQTLAAEGKLLIIDYVMRDDKQLECGIRINEQLKLSADAAR